MRDRTSDRSRVFACSECGTDPMGVPARDLPAALVEVGTTWQWFVATSLDHPFGPDALALRPHERLWSAVEYAGHVRDQLSVTSRRVEHMMLAKAPDLAPWDARLAVETGHYRALCAASVAADLVRASRDLGRLLLPMRSVDLARSGSVDGVGVTVDSLARTALHEARHHLRDARRVIAAVVN